MKQLMVLLLVVVIAQSLTGQTYLTKTFNNNKYVCVKANVFDSITISHIQKDKLILELQYSYDTCKLISIENYECNSLLNYCENDLLQSNKAMKTCITNYETCGKALERYYKIDKSHKAKELILLGLLILSIIL